LDNSKPSKSGKWTARYGRIIIALCCSLSLINSWGNNWFLTSFLGLGVIACGTIGIFDIKQHRF